MKNLKNTYQATFRKLKVDEDTKENIKQRILNSKNKPSFNFKLAIPGLILLIILVGTSSTIIADEIIDKLHFKVEIQNEYPFIRNDAIVNLKEDAKFPERKCDTDDTKCKTYSISELEESFGLKFLKNEYIKEAEVIELYAESNRDKIAHASYIIHNKNKYNNFTIAPIVISFDTKYYEKPSYDVPSGGKNYKYIYIKKLDTTVMHFIDKKIPNNHSVVLLYNSIFYRFNIRFTPSDNDNQEERIIEFLNSLSIE